MNTLPSGLFPSERPQAPRKSLLDDFYPVYFTLVMATGIVSIACLQQGLEPIGRGLYYFNIAAYGVLWALTLTRMCLHLPRLLSGLLDARRAFGYLTIIAATCMLGVQLLRFDSQYPIAALLWCVAGFLWCLLLYAFFTTLILRNQKPGLERDVNGGWLLAVVSSESVSVLGELLVPYFGPFGLFVRFFALCLFMLGAMMYTVIIVMIFQRLVLFPLTPMALEPLNWVDMGASAITTLAGANMVLHAPAGSLQHDLLIVIKGGALFFWVAASWWIPLLLILGGWRHLVKRYPLTYDIQYWGMVFPIGMYTVCTEQLATATGISVLHDIPRFTVYAAIGAWAVVFSGMLTRLVGACFAQAPLLEPEPTAPE